MARPLKVSLDYFPLDVHTDDSIELLESDCGLEGFAVLIKLWQKIYSEGYFIEWSDDNSSLFSRKISTQKEIVDSVVAACFKRKILSKALYEKYGILTGSGIQKRYLSVCNSAKRKYIPMITNYKLISGEFSEFITEETELIQEETIVNDGESTQRKVKESKGKEIKGKGSKENVVVAAESIEIIEYLNLITGSKFKPLTKITQDVIKARLKENYTVDDFKQVIDIKNAEWSVDPKMSKFLRPETLFGNKFESYLNQKPLDKYSTLPKNLQDAFRLAEEEKNKPKELTIFDQG